VVLLLGGPETPDDEKIRAARAYRQLSRCRPPFVYESEEAEFPEVDQVPLFAWEKEVFTGASSFPKPPPLSETPSNAEVAMHTFYKQLVEAQKEMETGIRKIKAYDYKYKPCPVEVKNQRTDTRAKLTQVLDQSVILAKESLNQVATRITGRNWFEDEKELWGQHYHQKKDYLDQSIAYLLFCKDHHPEEADRIKARDLLHKAEMAFVGHQGVPFARSPAHETKAFRNSGEATITHPYAVGLEEINFWMDKIAKTDSEEEKDQLFENMKVDMIIAFFHDTLEDHHMNENDVSQKLTEAFNLDGRVLTKVRAYDETYQKLPKNLNVAHRNMNRIMRALCALKEPDKNKEDYIPRQIGDLSEEEQPRVLILKIHDRLHNLKTLKYMGTHQQTKKILQTLEIIDFALRMANTQAPWREDLLIKASRITEVCVEELARISSDEDAKSKEDKVANTPFDRGALNEDLLQRQTRITQEQSK